MPQRILRDYTDSDAVNQLDAAAERFFVRLMMKADDFGLFTADKRLLRPSLFPLLLNEVREADLDRWIAACVKASLVRLYEVAGKRYLEIVNFSQRLRTKTNKHPLPPWLDVENQDVTDINDGGPPSSVSNMRSSARNLRPEVEVEVEVEVEIEEKDANASTRARRKSFQVPSLDEVRAYFTEKGYRQDAADKAFAYYEAGGWKDSKGNQVKNWKQKMQGVWFRDEHKAPTNSPSATADEAQWAWMQPVPFGDPERWTLEEYNRLKDRTEYRFIRYE